MGSYGLDPPSIAVLQSSSSSTFPLSAEPVGQREAGKERVCIVALPDFLSGLMGLSARRLFKVVTVSWPVFGGSSARDSENVNESLSTSSERARFFDDWVGEELGSPVFDGAKISCIMSFEERKIEFVERALTRDDGPRGCNGSLLVAYPWETSGSQLSDKIKRTETYGRTPPGTHSNTAQLRSDIGLGSSGYGLYWFSRLW